MIQEKKSYYLVLILLFFSGNQLAFNLFGKYNTLIGFVLTMLISISYIKFDNYFFSKFKIFISTIFIISLLQFLTLPFFSYLGYLNFLLKILMGGLIINSLKDKFPYILFKVVAWLSIISLIGFLSINIIGLNFPFIQIGKFYKHYIFYCTLPFENLLRNNGMFWEPGAFAGVLTLCLAVNFKYLKYYWLNHRFQLFSIITALISTQSTSGYLVGFFILVFYFYKPNKLFLSFFILSIIFSIGLYFYEGNDLLKLKIESQLQSSTEQEIGEFSNTRFGSLIFDLHYIKKNPFIGNGLDESTRYSDHKYLFYGEKGDAIGSGNAFSNSIASMGVFFILVYFILLWNSVITLNKLYAIVFTLVVFFNFQSEQWLNYPLYLGLPFIKLIKLNQKI